MVRWKCPSDLSDQQWLIAKNFVPRPASRGRRPICRRRIFNAILYVVRSGCQWRMLPSSFPHWNTVYGVFRRWKQEGVWEAMHHALRTRVRRASGRKSQPTAAILDSQSVRTAEGGEDRGYDAGKKITGRKRHIAVDTLGLIISVVVHGACWQDYDGACLLLARLQRLCSRLKVLFADSAYGRNRLPQGVQSTFGRLLHTVLRPAGTKGFVMLPKRWVVERTFAQPARHRRHSPDHERTTSSSEALVSMTMIGLMSKRLAKLKNGISEQSLSLPFRNGNGYLNCVSPVTRRGPWPRRSVGIPRPSAANSAPDQIAGRMRRERPDLPSHGVSRMTVSRWIERHAERTHWRSLLRFGQRRPPGDRRGKLKATPHISGRPAIVDERSRLGDWKGDTVVGQGHRSGLVTLVAIDIASRTVPEIAISIAAQLVERRNREPNT